MDKPSKPKHLAIWWPIIVIGCGIILYYLATLSLHTLPEPLMTEQEDSNTERFIAERAQILTTTLSNFGPKITGTDVNEIQAIEFLKTEVEKIISESSGFYNIEYDIQIASGSFPIEDSTSVYQGIQNFVVKVSPRVPTDTNRSTLLINSHFDSVPVSYGAGDAAIMVGSMLEVLRVISRSATVYSNPIIFLFNGAEENGLYASHAFITQHKWAVNIGGLINLDSCGSGGREMLFQSSPNAPWFVEQYAKSVPHPFSIVTAQELFEANFVPSDTDFRIFRDFGNVSGVDFAIIQNGYVYHTKSDRPEIIPIRTYQHLGDNLLAYVRTLAGSEELGKYDDQVTSAPVYFDFMGLFMISYPLTVAITINTIIFVIATIIPLLSLLLMAGKSGASKMSVILEFLLMIVVQLVTVIIGSGLLIGLATFYDAVNRSMSWFSSPWIVFGIYLCPLFYVLGLGPALYLLVRKKFCNKDGQDKLSRSYRVQMLIHANCFIIGLLSIIMTGILIKTAYIVILPVIFYTISTIINVVFKLIHHDRIWLVAIWIGQIIPFLYLAYFGVIAMEVFIPIQGRSGSTSNPDIMIAIFCILIGILQGCLFVPSFLMCKRPTIAYTGFLVLFAVFLIVMFTPVGFPYRENTSSQRFWIFHSERVFHSYDGSVRRSDSGYFMLGMDRHQNDFIEEHVPMLTNATSTKNECETELYCGLPLYSADKIYQTDVSHWVPAGKPIFNERSSIQLLNIDRDAVRSNRARYTFQISGTDHMALIISPVAGSDIVDWNISEQILRSSYQWNGRYTYFLKLAYCVISTPYVFNMEIESTSNVLPEPAVDIALSAHYVHHDELQTDEFKQFLSSFPKWTTITPWMSYYESWKF